MVVQGTSRNRRHAQQYGASSERSLRSDVSQFRNAWVLRPAAELRYPEPLLSPACRAGDPADRQPFHGASRGYWIPDRQRDIAHRSTDPVYECRVSAAAEAEIDNAGTDQQE